MYWSCSIMQSTYPSLIHPTAIIFSGAHIYLTLKPTGTGYLHIAPEDPLGPPFHECEVFF